MREQFGNAWELAKTADALCITTNGTITRGGRGVMGRGIAKQAKDRFPTIERDLGQRVRQFGNHVLLLQDHPGFVRLYSFPVKHVWEDKADIDLIERSAHELMQIVNERGYKTVLLPRPGCGNGGLQWEDVKRVIEPIFDDRIVIVEYAQSPEQVHSHS